MRELKKNILPLTIVYRKFILTWRDVHVGEKPGTFKKIMVLFSMSLPGLGCVMPCGEVTSAGRVSMLMEDMRSKGASYLRFFSSTCQLGWMFCAVVWVQEQAIVGQWGFMSRCLIGFSLSRTSSGAIGWYFIIRGVSRGEYFESVHRKLYVCMCF